MNLSVPPEPLRVLLVDDDPRNLLTLTAVLEGLDARLVSARSGSAALAALLKEDFALILLDVHMPDMDGYETATLIRQRPRSAHTPIIFVTANDGGRTGIHRGYEAGAVDFIVKPLDADVLRFKVSIFLDLHRKSEEIRRQAETIRLAEEREHQRELEELAAAERRRADAAVQRLLERQALVLSAVPLAVYTAAANGPSRTTSISPNVETLTGYSAELFLETTGFWLSRVHPDDREAVLALRETVRREGRGSCEYRWRRADGTWRWFLDHGVLSKDEAGEPQIGGTWLDISDRKTAEQALLDAHSALQSRVQEKIQEEERLKVTLRSIADGVLTTDPDGRVSLLSASAERLLGCLQAEVEGRLLSEVLVVLEERTHARVDLTTALTTPTPQASGLLRRADGVERLIQFQAAPIRAIDSASLGLVLVFRDVTALRRRDEELFKASKLESLGVLAGGIAHDFNNLLTGIMVSVSLADLRASRGQPLGDSLRQAVAACDRSRKLTQQLLTFARGGTPVKTVLDVAPVVRDAAAFALQGSRSRARIDIPRGLRSVEADAGQIGQVVQNLVLNADQAMPHGGIVRVSVENRTEPPEGAPHLRGPFVVLSVGDDGRGIAPEHLPKLFDPFYTTRTGGSGLGLTTVYSIVQRHGGHVEVASRLDEGSTFSVWLPAAAEEAAVVAEVPPPVLTGGHGHILVMDDEPAVLSASAGALEALGYQVTTCPDGAEAVTRYEAALTSGKRFDAVIMDLTVPGGMGGLEAARRLRALDSGVQVLVSTGYSADPVTAAPEAYGFVGVLGKPWQLVDLDRALRKVLRGSPSRPV